MSVQWYVSIESPDCTSADFTSMGPFRDYGKAQQLADKFNAAVDRHEERFGPHLDHPYATVTGLQRPSIRQALKDWNIGVKPDDE